MKRYDPYHRPKVAGIYDNLPEAALFILVAIAFWWLTLTGMANQPTWDEMPAQTTTQTKNAAH
ncbi:hypothetical protein IAD21_00598 [Abditibacteriota bacterium]|nr:hypothetical protein IAD21_00598 [Abditibacteriota bacterium]